MLVRSDVIVLNHANDVLLVPTTAIDPYYTLPRVHISARHSALHCINVELLRKYGIPMSLSNCTALSVAACDDTTIQLLHARFVSGRCYEESIRSLKRRKSSARWIPFDDLGRTVPVTKQDVALLTQHIMDSASFMQFLMSLD